MNTLNTNELKNQLDSLTGTLEKLKTQAKVIVAEIDEGRFISEETVTAFSDDLTEYQDRYTKFCNDGSALSLNACKAIEKVKAAINAYEESMQQESYRAIILDYFRLNSTDEKDISRLGDSKQKLAQICREDDNIRKAFAAYEIVIKNIKNNIQALDDDVFEIIAEQINIRIARALEGKRLYIDSSLDISEYLDDSCELLRPESQTIPITVPAEPTSTVTDKGDIPDKAETETDGNKHDNEDFTVQGHGEKTGDTASENKTEDKIHFDGFLKNVSFIYTDTPASELSVNKFKNDIKANPLIPGCMSAMSFLKFADPDSESDNRRCPALKDILPFLISEKYVTEASVTVYECRKKYYVLTSKGNACFERAETKKLLNDASIISPALVRWPTRHFTPAFAAQSLLIKSYIEEHNELTLIALCQYAEKTHFAFAPVKNTESGETLCIIAALFDEESFDMSDFQNAITALKDFTFIFLTKSKEDFELLKNSYKIHTSNGTEIKYAVIDVSDKTTDNTPETGSDDDDVVPVDPAAPEKPATEGNATWESLGISNPSDLIYNDKGIIVEQTESKKTSKAFSVKEFKNEMRKLPDTKKAVDILRALQFCKFINPQNVAAINRETENVYISYFEKLYQYGYLKKIQAENDEPYYCVTAKGCKIFSSKDSADYLEVKCDKQNQQFLNEPATEKTFVARKLYLRTIPLTTQLDGEFDFFGFTTSMGDCAFCVTYSPHKGNSYTYWGIISDKAENFEFDDQKVYEVLSKTNTLVFMGYNSAQAISLSDLFYTKYSEKLDGIVFKYYDYENDAFYDYIPTVSAVQDQKPEGTAVIPVNKVVPAEEDAEASQITADSEKTVSDESLSGTEAESTPVTEEYAQSGSTLSSETQAHINELTDSMITDGKVYCATAYLAAVSSNYPEYKPLYSQLAYAVNDPFCECSYNSQKIFDIYFHDNSAVSDYYVISAVLRNFFLDHNRFDYNMQSLYNSVRESSAYQISSRLKSIIRSLMEFKQNNGHGVDFYADYRIADGPSYENNLREICSEAQQLYSSQVEGVTKENAKNKRVLETKKLIFARNGDIATMLSYVASNELDNLELIRTTAGDLFIKDGAEFAYDNLDNEKIDRFIDDAWDAAQDTLMFKRSNIKLVSGLRQNVISRIKEALSILCRYVEIGQSSAIKQADKGYIAYKKIRSKLLDDIDTCIADYEKSLIDSEAAAAGKKTVVFTLGEIKDKITGNYKEEHRKYFYLPFLQNKYILLDDSYMPLLEDIEELKEMSAANRIEHHYRSTPMSYSARLTSILEGQDDYGSAQLIAQYLTLHPSEEADIEEISDKLKIGVNYPRESIKDIKKEFEEYLELAQFYGQIDNSVDNKKETILQIVEHWFETTLETDNYGFFNEILNAFKNKIKQDARIRENDLLKNLEAYKLSTEGWKENALINGTLRKIEDRIAFQNYSAAEDLLNRLQANDIEPDTPYIENDYLAEFLKEYNDLTRDAGTSRNSFGLSLTGNNKEIRGGKSLLDNWPRGTGAKPEKIEELLAGLGFNVAKLTPKPPILNRIDNFFVKLQKPVNGRKSNYKHPISIFGSEAEETDFRVVCVYGTRTPQDLIDIFKEIGNAKNTIVLLDHTMNLPDRRDLARRTKKEFNGKTFIVIDRVVITYLAKHYSQTATNRMLMAITVPFAYYQPYISDSSKVMPPEIFMGRRAELEKIESPSGVNIVYGGRQLGKSALLRMAQKDIDWDENGDRAILVDIKGRNYQEAARRVAEELSDQLILDKELTFEEASDWNVIGREIKKVLRNGNSRGKIPYLLLLLDEADVFIESCEEVNYAPFDALKDIQTVGAGRFKFVVAGLRNVVRLKQNVALGNNSVLTHLSHLTVTPFKTSEARELLEVPLSYLGFRFPDDSKTDMLISNIFGTTNYFPGLLQMYCAKLIEAMKKDYAGYDQSDTPPYYIREEHIKKVLADKSLEQQIREKFMITLKVDEDDYYYQLALLAAFHYHNIKTQSGCSPKDLHEIALEYGLSKIADLSVDEIGAFMEELRELNVFQLVGNGNYRFVRHSFCGMMGSAQEIDDKILEYAD